MELPDTRDILSLLYNDKMTISRINDEPDEYGIINTKTREVIYKEEPCKLSLYTLSKEDNPADDNIYFRRADTVVKLFCDPKYYIKQGDWIKVYRKRRYEGADYELFFEGLCNKPSVHGSHQEVSLSEKELN